MKNSEYYQTLDDIGNYFTNIFSQNPSSPSPSPPPTSIYDLPIENYKYNITNESDCDSSYGVWVPNAPGGPKCYELYKVEQLDGQVQEFFTTQDECESDGYGKWLTDIPGDDKCVRLNKNKSDCLLSGGIWNPTDDDYSPTHSSQSHDNILCPIQATAFSKLALKYLNDEDTSSMSQEELEEKEDLIKKKTDRYY